MAAKKVVHATNPKIAAIRSGMIKNSPVGEIVKMIASRMTKSKRDIKDTSREILLVVIKTKYPSLGYLYNTYAWLGIRDDYRTLIGFEGVNVVDKSSDNEEDEDDE
jgi:hypothetical protein